MANDDVWKCLFKAAPNSGPGSFSARDGHLNSVFDTGIVLRIAEMHSFLKKHLFEYSACCLENLQEELHDAELPLDRPADSSEVLICFLICNVLACCSDSC